MGPDPYLVAEPKASELDPVRERDKDSDGNG
jgi:hypothetical protein